MSQVHRVLVLNKPFKLRGYTLFQWLILGLGVTVALVVGTKVVPQTWKLAGVPAGLWVGIVIFGVAGGYVKAIEAKPLIWWKNRLVYGLKLVPTVYLPKREGGVVYPDPTIKEAVKREDQSYVIERDDDDR